VEKARDKQKVVSIHLFGIRYSEQLRNISLPELVAKAGVHTPYATEIRKGMNLAKYVTLK